MKLVHIYGVALVLFAYEASAVEFSAGFERLYVSNEGDLFDTRKAHQSVPILLLGVERRLSPYLKYLHLPNEASADNIRYGLVYKLSGNKQGINKAIMIEIEPLSVGGEVGFRSGRFSYTAFATGMWTSDEGYLGAGLRINFHNPMLL